MSEQITIACPECGRPLIERTNKVNGSTFLGCSGWPDHCQHTQRIPEYLKLLREGATPLPGFGS